MPRALHQFVAGYSHADAISNEARALRSLFRDWGYASDIFSDTPHILPQLRRDAFSAHDYAARSAPDDIVLLHLSIGSAVNDVFLSLPCRKAILYHNVTPPAFFALVNRKTGYALEKGLQQVRTLAGSARVTMADSQFNAAELSAMGYPDVRVLPLVMDFSQYESRDAAIVRRFRDGLVNVLFVGRCAPNKKIEDCLAAFMMFQRHVEPNSRFIHVGSRAGTERYYSVLVTRAKELGLRNLYFAGSVPQPQLNAFYAASDLFLCMSEHEGFCIPLIESMVHGVPVLAYAAGAVPETLAGAGVLLREKDYPVIAETMGELQRNAALRAAVVARQRTRVEQFQSRDLADEVRTLLAPLLQANDAPAT